MPSTGIKSPLRVAELDRRNGRLRQIDIAVLRRNFADHFDRRRLFVAAPGNVQHLGAIMRVAGEAAFAIAAPGTRPRFEPGAFVDRRQRHPGLRLALGIGDLQPGDDFELTPHARLRREGRIGCGKSRQPGGERHGGAGLQDIAAIKLHDRYSSVVPVVKFFESGPPATRWRRKRSHCCVCRPCLKIKCGRFASAGPQAAPLFAQ
jgi:hypothetical protein